MARRPDDSAASASGDRAPADRLADVFWSRHSNPWSAGTRILATPVLLFALYHRERRLLAATIAFVAVNPVLFPPPESTDSWLSRGVLAERVWLRSGEGTLGVSYPNVLNLLNVPTFLFAVYSAARRRPLATVVGTAVSMALKLWWVDAIVRRTGESSNRH